MITDFLIEHREAAPLLLVAAVVLGLVVGRLLVPRPRWAWGLCGVAVVGVVALTLVPSPSSVVGDVRCTAQWALPTFGRVELLANVALFVPPTLLAGVASGRPRLALLGAAVGSALIETVQAVVPPIGRACDTGDWLCNVLGALIGAGLAWVALRQHRRRQRTSERVAPPR